jgi:SMC interacting uncharacterized protein involved in chromosome segregation
MKEIKPSEMFQAISQFEKEWERQLPEELREIESLAIELSKALHNYKDDKLFCKKYTNDICNEIKQLAYDFQRKIGHSR